MYSPQLRDHHNCETDEVRDDGASHLVTVVWLRESLVTLRELALCGMPGYSCSGLPCGCPICSRGSARHTCAIGALWRLPQPRYDRQTPGTAQVGTENRDHTDICRYGRWCFPGSSMTTMQGSRVSV